MLLYAAIIFASLVACVLIFILVYGDIFAPSKPKLHRVEVGGVHMVIPTEYMTKGHGHPGGWRQGKKQFVKLSAGGAMFTPWPREVHIFLSELIRDRLSSTQGHLEKVFFQNLEPGGGQPGPFGLRIQNYQKLYLQKITDFKIEDQIARTRNYTHRFEDGRLLMIKCSGSRCRVGWRNAGWLHIRYEYNKKNLMRWHHFDKNVLSLVRGFKENARNGQ